MAETGRELHLKDFLNEGDGWKEGNFAVPKIGDVAGLGVYVDECSDSDAITLEFRADGDYKRIDLTVAPGRDTRDSSQTLVVGLYDNGTFIDSRKVAYGKVARFRKVNIADVSALKIRVWGQGGRCGYSGDEIFAVLYDIVVQ